MNPAEMIYRQDDSILFSLGSFFGSDILYSVLNQTLYIDL